VIRDLTRLRARLEPVPGQATAHPMRNGVITLAVLVVTLTWFFAASLRPDGLGLFGGGGRLVRAEFSDTADLKHGDPVRVSGVDVGRVQDLELTDHRTALVTMRLSGAAPVIHHDARAQIYWRLILGGNDYVALEPGSRSRPVLGDSVIPVSRTLSQQRFDDLSEPYNPATRAWQRTIFGEVAKGLDDPRAASRAITTLAPTLKTVGEGVAPLRGQWTDDVRSLITSTARTMHGLAVDDHALQGLVSGGAGTFGVFAAHRKQFGNAIEASPAAMDATVSAMRHTIHTLDLLDPLVAGLRPGARVLDPALIASRPALTQLAALLHEARPFLLNLGPTFAALRRAGDEGVPLMHATTPTLDRLHNELLPFLRKPDPEIGVPTYQMIGPTAEVGASAAAEYDRNGTYLRFPVFADERSVGAAPCQPFLTDPSSEEKVRCEALRKLVPLP
jgi:virulence factor Mce-like protein